MRMCDLQQKDIVNTKDGKKIGRISDLIVSETGNIEYLIVEPTKFFRKYTSFNSETNIKFGEIIKFGSDVILVDLTK